MLIFDQQNQSTLSSAFYGYLERFQLIRLFYLLAFGNFMMRACVSSQRLLYCTDAPSGACWITAGNRYEHSDTRFMLSLAIALVILSGLLVWAEIWLPSFGTLSILAVISIIAAFVLASKSDYEHATLVTIIATVLTLPLSILLAVKLIEYSPVGHRTQLTATIGDSEHIRPLKDLVGKTGIAYTDLRPSGSVLINDKKYDVVAVSGYIEKGTPVQVIKAEGAVVTVKTADEPPKTPVEPPKAAPDQPAN